MKSIYFASVYKNQNGSEYNISPDGQEFTLWETIDDYDYYMEDQGFTRRQDMEADIDGKVCGQGYGVVRVWENAAGEVSAEVVYAD